MADPTPEVLAAEAQEAEVGALEARINELELENADLKKQLETVDPASATSAMPSVPEMPSMPSVGGGGGQTMTAMSVLNFGTKIRMNPLQLRKAGAIIQNMQGAEPPFDEEQINDVCRALFCDQCEEDMQLAWKVFDSKGEGSITAEEFKKSLPLMGEEVPEERINQLFTEADTDGSGNIEFPEFVVMVKGMNPKESEAPESPSEGGGMFGGFSMPGAGMLAGAGQTMTAMSVLDGATKVKINPLQIRKAGAIIQNMQGNDPAYSDQQINDVCRALFLDQSEEDMKLAWKVFDLSGKGELDAAEFKKALPLMGEDVPEEKIQELFQLADKDGSGRIEFPEFIILMKGMNPKEDSGAAAEGGGMFGGFSIPTVPGMPAAGGEEEAAAPAAEEPAAE